ncbi:Fanconi anemia group M [Chionoecetes opilio]|uniref:Fanconi anemia group M n=1 Tax=Chionoecetes opilio TaxID=41210 RepID=A0A8J4YC22_CHIOP|nr:Fanconi anemia group M [Chionoecetes opilio]
MTELSQKFEADPSVAQTSQQGHSTLFSQVGSPRGPKVTPAAPFIISHPKMVKLLSIVLEHHQKSASEGNSTRIMIFSQYRDSVMEITEMLQRHHPTVKAMSFIGHSTAGLNGKGLSQKKQLQVVSKFREGGYNTLVSTCVGEEGLDIGDVDLIICYDAPKSPIRLVQRMGRTGRKREGRIVVLVTKGKEEQSYDSSQYQKRAINKALANTSRLARYLSPSSPRMVPRGLSPTCLKLHMKVEVWKANTKGCKSTPKDRGSILSMISRAGSSSSKSTSGAALMSPDEREWYQKIRVPSQEVRTLPAPSLICMDASKRELDSNTETHINLGSYQPWQSLAQKTHLVGHAPHALNLVELTEFIQLQQHIDPGEDPYGLEMAAFLDKAYVEGKDTSKTSTTTDSSACVTAPLRKAVADQLQDTLEDDDDEDFVALLGPPKQQEQKAKNVRKKKKRKRLDYLDDEAELTKDGEISVSSDESDDEEKEYDRSFVDDGTYLSQDNALDMRAVYLRSVVSPMKRWPELNLPPPPKYRHDSDGSEDEEEDEDSFVVDNSFVEYETEYVGDTMLAEDPIINQEAVGVLVDSGEVNSGGNVLSRLRLHYGAQTAVVHLQHAHYAVSTRMAVIRLSLAVFSSAQHRSKLVQRVQAMLELYERPVLVVEGEAAKASSPAKAPGRSRYLDTIVCACTQVAPLKVLYSKGQVSNRFDVLGDPVELWDTFKRETLQAAKECIGEHPRSRRGFVARDAGENRGESRCQACWEPGPAQGSVT